MPAASILDQTKDHVDSTTASTVEAIESGNESRRNSSSSDEEWQAGAAGTRTSDARQTLADKMKDINKATSDAKKNVLEEKEAMLKNIKGKKSEAQTKMLENLKGATDAASKKMEESKKVMMEKKQNVAWTKNEAVSKAENAKKMAESKFEEKKKMATETMKVAADKADETQKMVAEHKQKALQMKDEIAGKAEEVKTAADAKLNEAKKAVHEKLGGVADQAAALKEKGIMLEANAVKAASEQKEKAAKLKNEAIAKAKEAEEAVKAKVAEAKAVALEQQEALSESVTGLKDALTCQKEAIAGSAADVVNQVQGTYQDISNALAPVLSAGADMKKRMPRKRVIVAGLAAVAAAAGVGYWIYKTYYADGSTSIDVVAGEAYTSSSLTFSSWFGGPSSESAPKSGEAAAQQSSLASWFGSLSAATTAPATEVGAGTAGDEASTLMSTVGKLLDTEKAAEAMANVPEIAGAAAGAALSAVEDIVYNDNVQIALRGITREFFTQLDVLSQIFEDQQKGIMAYLGKR